MSIDAAYAALLGRILCDGERIETRNSLCRRLIAEKIVFASTPLVSARKTAWKNCLREWEWFMSGSNSIHDLHPAVRPWWEPWADKRGLVANNYSQQFRCYGNTSEIVDRVDQIGILIDGIGEHPYSRRNVITTWNTADMISPVTQITNCHGTVIQAFVDVTNALHLLTYQRSCDMVCGVPHNWFQYWAFLLWTAHLTKHPVGSLTWIGGDVHIYETHDELARKIVSVSAERSFSTPELVYNATSKEFMADDFTLSSLYRPAILDRAEMVV